MKFTNIVEEDRMAIISPSLTDNGIPVEYYDLSGKRLTAPVRGLNILRMSDGIVRKVVMK